MKTLLIVLLLIAPTLQYRAELGPFSITLLEPMVIAVSGLLLAHQITSRRRMVIVKDPLLFFFFVITMWSLLVRPWAQEWQNGLSDARDWIVPVIGYVVLVTTIRSDWRKWTTLFFGLVFLNSFLGIYQHFTDGFRPFVIPAAAFKSGFLVAQTGDRLAPASFAAGFFTHPNSFATYLFAGLMIGLGLTVNSRRSRTWGLIMIIPVAMGLFWTYAKASLLVMLSAIVFFALHLRIRSQKCLIVALLLAGSAGTAILFMATRFAPPVLLNTLWWRIGLWKIALTVIADNPAILLIGNGVELFADQAYYFQPHNLYVYMLLQYGLFGLVWVLLLLWQIWRCGWRARRAGLMDREPVLAALWVVLLGYCAVGFVESNLLGIEGRLIFFWLAASFTGLLREVSRGDSVSLGAATDASSGSL